MTIEPGVLITPSIVFGTPYVNEASSGTFTAGELLPAYNIVFGTPCISIGATGVNLPGFLLSPYQIVFGDALVGVGPQSKTFFPGALVQVSARPGLVTDTGLLLVLGFYVNFSATPLLGYKYQTIHFTDETYGTFIASWYWEFGDGQTSTLQNPTHSYINTGYYSVRLRVTSTNGDISEVYKVNYIRIVALPGSSIGGNKELFGFKLESSPYTPETLASSDYRYPVYDVKVAPDIEVNELEVNRGDYSNVRSISGRRSCGVNFSVDVYGMPSPATPPSYFEILRACGWKQIVHGTTGVSIRPDSSLNRVPATIEVVFEDDSDEPSQMVYKLSGAMGSARFIGEVGDPLKIEFTFIGALEYIRTRVYDDRIVPANFDAAVPSALLGAKSCIWMGRTTAIESFEVNSNEAVNLFTNIFRSHGYDGARVIDRIISGKFKIGGFMSLVVWQVGGVAAIGFDASTGERGFLVKLINRTGETSVKGTLVSRSTAADGEVIKQANEYDCVGIVAEAGVVEGAEMWVWKNGSVCQVLFKDGTAATRANILIADAVDGRASDIANPGGGLPGTDTHFKECGHVCESKGAGTNVLVLADIHFN